MVRCDYCGQLNRNINLDCRKCGAPLPEEKKKDTLQDFTSGSCYVSSIATAYVTQPPFLITSDGVIYHSAYYDDELPPEIAYG
jgi:tRNA(Ile2) C34 agmatinyltransferase TiaS